MKFGRTRTFCCCLPVRLGTFVLSLLTLVGSGVLAGSAWYYLIKYAVPTTTAKVALIVAGVVWSLMTFASLAGFIGAVGKNRKLVGLYSSFLWLALALHVAVAILDVVVFIRNRDYFTSECMQREYDQPPLISPHLQHEVCSKAEKIYIAILVVFSILVLLINLWLALIVKHYCDQLDDERAGRAVTAVTTSAFAPPGAAPSGGMLGGLLGAQRYEQLKGSRASIDHDEEYAMGGTGRYGDGGRGAVGGKGEVPSYDTHAPKTEYEDPYGHK